MKKECLLDKLERGEPVFTDFPTHDRRLNPVRVCGMECEFGVESGGDQLCKFPPTVLPNGGQFYIDCNHVEFCTGECSDALWLLAQHEAGKREAVRNFPFRLFNNVVDWRGNCFGVHENVFTSADPKYWYFLIPFLMARTVLNGSGLYRNDEKYQISQRATYIAFAHHNSATSPEKPIFLTRFDDPLHHVVGFNRMHIAISDGKVNQSPLFISFGILLLAVRLLEKGIFPSMPYNKDLIQEDMIRLSTTTNPNSWYLGGMRRPDQRGVLEILSICHDAMRVNFYGQGSEVDDAVIDLFEDTLNKFSRPNFMELLCRRIDWVQKLWILKEFGESLNGDPTRVDCLMSCDMEYHCLNLERSLLPAVEATLRPEKILSEAMVERARIDSCPDTRSLIRGKSVQLCQKISPGRFKVAPRQWDEVSVVLTESGLTLTHHELPDPRESYGHLVREITETLSSNR